jgi:site-specific recombinase XerD
MLISESVRTFSSDYIWQKGYSTSTANNYRWAINSFIKACGDIELTELSMDHVLAWRKYMERNTYEQSAINCNLYKLRSLLVYFQSRANLSINPQDIIVPKAKKTIPKYLTPEQLELLMDKANTREKAIIAVLYASGVRVGELCQLRKKDILGGCMKVRGKGNIERLAFLNDQAIAYLDKYLETRDDNSPYLFPSKKGGGLTVSSIQHIMKNLSDQLPFDITPHVLRHTFATHLAQNGCGAFHLQKLLGHSHISTTQIYVHLSGQDIQEAYKKYHPSSSMLT